MNLLIQGNSLNIPLANQSVNCCVTSPPYYGLRDYGTAKWEGGSPDCDHKGKPMATHAGFNERYFGKPSIVDKQGEVLEFYKDACAKCGAIRIDSQIGLEQTPNEYVAKLVDVFREVKRVLRDDGTLWLNLGDSYAGSGNGSSDYREDGASISKNDNKYGNHKPLSNVPAKNLLGIPWRVAFALQADGWYLRSDIIWAKPNPMPESVKDRCTKSHEYIFLLSKNARYYYDYEAILENAKTEPGAIWADRVRAGAGKIDNVHNSRIHTHGDGSAGTNLTPQNGKRNKRSVWTVTTKPYKGAHYATFPPDLIEPCILAGCPQGGVVLDPFAGSGTTVMVANRNNRKGIGLDLSWKYLVENAKVRIDNGK